MDYYAIYKSLPTLGGLNSKVDRGGAGVTSGANQSPIGITPFIRENDINFAAASLKPDNAANFFFDDIKVNLFCQRASSINVTSNTAVASLKTNEGIYGATSKAYAEVLGTSVTSTDNLVYLNDNFISVHMTKGSGAASLSSTDFKIGDLVYQTSSNTIINFNAHTGGLSPSYAFLGKVKKWEYINTTNGILVLDPLLGTLETSLSNTSQNRIWNATTPYIDVKEASYTHANNRFVAGETVTSTDSGTTVVVAAANSYVAISSAVSGSNSSGNLRSIVISSNNITRDGIGTGSGQYIVGNTITVVSGTNQGFSANVVAVVDTTANGWSEAILDADLPAVCTSNSVYSIGSHKVNDVGSIYGIFHIPSESNLRWLTGERVFTITDTATYNDDAYKMRAIAKYSAVGRVDTSENTRNPVLREQSPSTLQAATNILNSTAMLNNRKYTSQTFFTPPETYSNATTASRNYGYFVTSIDLFFKAKPTNAEELLPVTVALSPVENGVPGQAILASKTLSALEVKVSNSPSSSNANTYTKFTFNDPVYLPPGREWAIKIITESPDYSIWTATLGESYTDELGNLRRVSEQPYVGNFFTSQNASNWNPILNQDLMFRINRAVFENSNTSYFNITAAPDVAYKRVFDHIKLYATETIPTPCDARYYVKTFTVDGTDAGWEEVQPNEIYSFAKDTNISSTSTQKRRLMLGANTQSINVKVDMTTTDTSVAPIINRERLALTALTNIVNNGGLANGNFVIVSGGEHSNAANITVTISAPTKTGGVQATANVPYLVNGKIERLNIINPGSGYTTSPTVTITEPSATSNAIIQAWSEDRKNGGNMLARYVSKTVTLEQGFDAGDIVVGLSAYRPVGTDILAYVKVLSSLDPDSIDDKSWVPLQKVRDNVSPDLKTPTNIEYKYSLTKGQISYNQDNKQYPLGGTFKQFKVKLCLTSSDPTVTPRVDMMRVIAVPGG